MSNKKPITVSDHILEVRFEPDPYILDVRGTWANTLSTELGFESWVINENRIDLSHQEPGESAFLSYRNCGYKMTDPDTVDLFAQKAAKLIHKLATLPGFPNQLDVHRVGVRTRVGTEFFGTFDQLRQRYEERYAVLTDNLKSTFHGQVLDVGFNLNFADHLGNFNTMSGPMTAEQLKNFLGREASFPAVSVFLDIDYFIAKRRLWTLDELARRVKEFATEGWAKRAGIYELMVEQTLEKTG